MTSNVFPAVSNYQNQSEILPGIKSAVLKKIRTGKFVDFALLLPNTEIEDQCEVNVVSRKKVRITGPAGGTNKINTFTHWLYAWNQYLRVMIVFHPHLTQQLIFYQSEITDMYTRWTFKSIMTYDTQFRMKIANKTIARWDFHDISCRSSHLVPLPKPMSLSADSLTNSRSPLCYACKQQGHFQNSPLCPLFAQANLQYIEHRVSHAPYQNQTQSLDNQPFLAPQRNELSSNTVPTTKTPRGSAQIPNQTPPQTRRSNHCSFWNNGNCINQKCRYLHACEICGKQEHTGVHCPQRHQKQH